LKEAARRGLRALPRLNQAARVSAGK
jgi:hypothetical protein